MRYTSYLLFVIGLSLLFIAVTTFFKASPPHIPSVENGVIDLRDVENLDSTIVHLDGTWDFYWKQFTLTDESVSSESRKTGIVVPKSWGIAAIDGTETTNIGYGTYELNIVIPDELVDKTFGLYIPSVATAYKLWIDEKLLLTSGTIAKNEADMVPENYARVVYFQPSDETIKVTFEVANFSQRKGGLWESIQFGVSNEISLLRDKHVAFQLLVVGAFTIMGIYNIFIYLLRNSLFYTKYIGFLCLMLALRTLVIGETFLLNVFPGLTWELQVKLEYLPIVFGPFLLVKYIHALYKEERLLGVERLVTVISIIFALIVLVMPAIFYTKYLAVLLIIIPLTIIYFGNVLLNAYVAGQPTSLLTLLSFTIFIVPIINDTLYFLNITNNGTYSVSGLFVFILSQSFVHAIQISNTYSQVEKLSEELLQANRSLEKKVEERTKESSHLYEKLRESEEERKNLMSDLAHEISKPLTLIKGYSEAMVDGKIEPQKDFLQIIYQSSLISERLIHDLSELSKLEMGELKMQFEAVELKQYPKHIFEHHRWTVENEGKRFIWIDQDEWQARAPEDAIIYIDENRMDQVWMNLIDNALSYAQDGKNIYMEVEWHANFDAMDEIAASGDTEKKEAKFAGEKIGECIIKIIDEGKGITQEDLPFIFNRSYRALNKPENDTGRGLGLAISIEIVKMHGGTIWVNSVIGKGSTFFISLPVYSRKGKEFPQ